MKHILIIDDDRTSINCAKIALGDLYKLSTCSTGPNAIKFLETTIPDLLLLDVNMPFMDGFELIRRIQSDPRTQDIPLVILTGAIDEEIQRKCKEVGALDYIIKPFVPSDLQIRMEQVFLNLERSGRFANDSVGTKDYRQLAPFLLKSHSLTNSGCVVARSFTPVIACFPEQYGHPIPFVRLAMIACHE